MSRIGLCDDYNYDSTSIRRPFDCLSKVIKVTVTYPVVTLTCLFIQGAVHQPGRNVGHRMVVARSNCSRIEIESKSNIGRIVVVTTALSVCCSCCIARLCALSDREIINNNGMVAYTMKDVRKLGIEEVVRRAIEHVSPKCVKLFIIRLILTFSHDYYTASFSL